MDTEPAGRGTRRLAAFFIFAGAMHFIRPRWYEAIMPDYLPAQRELVYASGVAEAAGGAAVLLPATRRLGGWGLIATLIAVLPANVWMAQHPERYANIPRAGLLARLPVQLLLIYWVWRVALRDR